PRRRARAWRGRGGVFAYIERSRAGELERLQGAYTDGVQTVDALAAERHPWAAEWKGRLAQHANSIGMGIVHAEHSPYESNYLDLDPNVRDRAALPVVRCTYDLRENEFRA